MGKSTDSLHTPLTQEQQKALLGQEIAKRIKSGQTLGIGSGSTVIAAIRAIGERIGKDEISDIKAVASSDVTEEEARQAGIKVVRIDDIGIDWGFDGADEVAFRTQDGKPVAANTLNGYDSLIANMIKGGGGAMLREKQVAKSCPRWIIIVDQSKVVDQLGAFSLPVEFKEDKIDPVREAIENINDRHKPSEIRLRTNDDGTVYKTDNGNPLFMVSFPVGSIDSALQNMLFKINGVEETGAFLGGYPDEVLIAYETGEIKSVIGPGNR